MWLVKLYNYEQPKLSALTKCMFTTVPDSSLLTDTASDSRTPSLEILEDKSHGYKSPAIRKEIVDVVDTQMAGAIYAHCAGFWQRIV